MQIKELCDYHKNAQVDNGGDKGKKKDRGSRYMLGRSDKFRDNQGPQFHTYTSLNGDRGKIMDEALHADLILALKKLQRPKDVDMSKQCCYHRNFGHTTKECQALKNKIKKLVQAGHLRKIVQSTNMSTNKRYPFRDERMEFNTNQANKEMIKETHYHSHHEKSSQ